MNKKMKKSHNENFIVVLFYPYLLLYIVCTTNITFKISSLFKHFIATYCFTTNELIRTHTYIHTFTYVVRVTIRFDSERKTIIRIQEIKYITKMPQNFAFKSFFIYLILLFRFCFQFLSSLVPLLCV